MSDYREGIHNGWPTIIRKDGKAIDPFLPELNRLADVISGTKKYLREMINYYEKQAYEKEQAGKCGDSDKRIALYSTHLISHIDDLQLKDLEGE